jgi:steroid delta-isomerase-like uncharacterized protein
MYLPVWNSLATEEDYMSRLSKLLVYVLAFALIVNFSLTQTPKAAAQDDLKTLAKAVVDAVNTALKTGDTSAYEALASADYVETNAPQGTNSMEYFKTGMQQVRGAFPDAQYEIVDMVAEGDQVWVRTIITGTHTGDGLGIPATGKKLSLKGATFLTFKDGKLVKHDSLSDTGNLYEQLGFTITPPTPEAAATPAS